MVFVESGWWLKTCWKNPWETRGKPWESHETRWKNPWENHGKNMKNPVKTCKNYMNNWCELIFHPSSDPEDVFYVGAFRVD